MRRAQRLRLHLPAAALAAVFCPAWVAPVRAADGSTAPPVAVVAISAAELSTARDAVVAWTVRCARPGRLAADVLSPDGDVVRRIEPRAVSAGEHAVPWNGRDAEGRPVPDEAYTLRARLETADGEAVDDPRARSGGEVLAGLLPAVTGGGDITYTLPRPGRVLIRVGVRGGAMLRSLSVWRPRPGGRNLQRWNGFDEAGLVDLRNDRLALLVTAFALPDHAVITTGQAQADYRAWRRLQGWPEPADPVVGTAEAPLERNGVRVARQHHQPRWKDREPRIEVTLTGPDGRPWAAGMPLPAAVQVQVDLHPDDRWLMEESLYEVAFFVDGDFVSEEENGYVPISWIWNTERLEPGRRLLTVNLTGFTGRVGTRTLAVTK